jgi:putative zinc finger/helix-turn-helix YgiT family protein
MFDFLCEECGKGKVRKRTVQNFATKVRGYPFVVPVAVVGGCDNCGAQIFDPQEVRRWNELFAAQLDRRGDLLTPQQIRSIREQLGLSIGDFAKLIGSTRQSVYNWEREERKSPQIRLVDLLLKLIRESRALGKVDVPLFLRVQAKAVGANVTIKAASDIPSELEEKRRELASAGAFDQLFNAYGSPTLLPRLQ